MMPPRVSMPSDSGVTSSSSTSCTSPASTPPWIAAPTATTSSGLTPLCGSLPSNISLTTCCTLGTRVEPPTSTTSSMSFGREMGVLHRLLHRPAAPLDQVIDQLFELRPGDGHLQVLRPAGVGRDERQVDVGRLGRAKFLLGLFAGLLQPLQGHRVLAEVDAVLLLELVGHVVDQHWSKSSPPRWVSPLVLMTRNTPSATSSTETSNVPPPRSKTTIFSFFFLSRP